MMHVVQKFAHMNGSSFDAHYSRGYFFTFSEAHYFVSVLLEYMTVLLEYIYLHYRKTVGHFLLVNGSHQADVNVQ